MGVKLDKWKKSKKTSWKYNYYVHAFWFTQFFFPDTAGGSRFFSFLPVFPFLWCNCLYKLKFSFFVSLNFSATNYKFSRIPLPSGRFCSSPEGKGINQLITSGFCVVFFFFFVRWRMWFAYPPIYWVTLLLLLLLCLLLLGILRSLQFLLQPPKELFPFHNLCVLLLLLLILVLQLLPLEEGSNLLRSRWGIKGFFLFIF